MKDLFIQFLKEHSLFFRFKAYFIAGAHYKNWSFEEYLDKYDPVHYVTGAFGWPDTDEGKDFWEGVDTLWDEYREKYEKWQYTITFKSSELNAEFLKDVAKLLSEKYGVVVTGNLKMSSNRISK